MYFVWLDSCVCCFAWESRRSVCCCRIWSLGVILGQFVVDGRCRSFVGLLPDSGDLGAEGWWFLGCATGSHGVFKIQICWSFCFEPHLFECSCAVSSDVGPRGLGWNGNCHLGPMWSNDSRNLPCGLGFLLLLMGPLLYCLMGWLVCGLNWCN